MPSCLSAALNQRARKGAGFLARLGGVVAWWGVTVEARSAFARLVHDRELSSAQRATAITLLEQLRRSWDEILPTEAVRTLAESPPDHHGVRAGDAWQLAAALVWCSGRPFVCLDKRLSKAASDMGSTVHPH